MDLNYDAGDVANLDLLLDNQRSKIARLRERVKQLKFVPLEPGGTYNPVSFKSFDGGLFNLHFDPFEFDIVDVADSNGNIKLKFAAPGGDLNGTEDLRRIIHDLDDHPIIRDFLDILGKSSLLDISEILTDRGTLMEIGEFACIFNRVMSAPTDEKTIVLRDGLLRTKKIKDELITLLGRRLQERKNHVKVVGVAKTSKVMFLLKAALLCERTFPPDQIGYVKIPLDLENMAYRWSGRGLLDRQTPTRLSYAFGSLYIAKLSRSKNMFVTVEIPDSPETGRDIYSTGEIMEIMSYLAKDSAHSYPVIGYPQTIMRAHEFAAGTGLPSSILRDNIIKDLVAGTDPALAEYVRDSQMLGETMDRGSLGGRA